MVRYLNATEVGYLLYLDTKPCIQEDTAKPHIIDKSDISEEVLYVLTAKKWGFFCKSAHK